MMIKNGQGYHQTGTKIITSKKWSSLDAQRQKQVQMPLIKLDNVIKMMIWMQIIEFARRWIRLFVANTSSY